MAKKKAASKTASRSGDAPAFEKSLADLEKIVAELEAGQLTLSDSIERYEKGVKLLKQCHKALDDVQRKIEVVTRVTRDGEATTVPFDADRADLAEDEPSSSVDEEGRLF